MPRDPLWGDALYIDDTSGQRWKVALELLADGGYIVWRGNGLTFRSQEPAVEPRVGSTLFVRVGTEWEPQNVTPTRAESELLRAQAELEELKGDSADFAKLVAGRPVVYELIYDYGMGAVRLAMLTEAGFKYQWK